MKNNSEDINIVEKLQKRYNKIYLDILKHQSDIEKWIREGKRKKGDIRRSLKRLDNKYNELEITHKQLKREWLMESDILNGMPNKHPKLNLSQINHKIDRLYDMSNIDRPRQYKNKENIYGKDIDVINDIPGFNEKDNQLIQEEKEEEKYLMTNKRNFNNLIQKVKEDIKGMKKIARRSLAVGFAAVIAIFGGATISDSNSNISSENVKAYSNTNKNDNNFKENLHVDVSGRKKVVKNVEVHQNKSANKSKKETNKGKKNKKSTEYKQFDDYKDSFYVEEGVTYTEVSDGTGNEGSFSKPQEVKIYNMALVKTHKNGVKEIGYATDKNESWVEYAEREGIDIKEIQEYAKSVDVAMCYSLQSEDGTKLFGWVNKNNLKKVNKSSNEKIKGEKNEGR